MAISKHLLFTVLFLVGFLLAFSEPLDNRRPSRPPPRPRSPPPPRRSPLPPRPSPPTPSPPPPPSNPPGFDYFLLVLQWPNAYCVPSSLCKPPTPKQYFTIHGLWPQTKYGAPEFCDTDQIMTDAILKRNKDDLLKYWPRLPSAEDFEKSKKLWNDQQWKKHGTCSSNKFCPDAYLKTTIALAEKYGPLILKKMEEGGIKPDNTARYTVTQIQKAIKNATETEAKIRCSKSNETGALELSDVRLCVEADGKTLQNCTGDLVGICKGELLFRAPEPSIT